MSKKPKLLIRELLREKGNTAVWLANEIEITQPNMSNIVSGKSTPSLETLEKIANALKVPITDLFENEGINGFVKFNGKIYEISSKSDLENLLNDVKELELKKKE